jgi:hypothetical protein
MPQPLADAAQAAKVRDEYLAYTEKMLDWFETLAKEAFGRDIPQILLNPLERSAHRRARRAADDDRAPRVSLGDVG